MRLDSLGSYIHSHRDPLIHASLEGIGGFSLGVFTSYVLPSVSRVFNHCIVKWGTVVVAVAAPGLAYREKSPHVQKIILAALFALGIVANRTFSKPPNKKKVDKITNEPNEIKSKNSSNLADSIVFVDLPNKTE